MTSQAFDYTRPDSIDDALSLLATPGSVVLAGGQSLVPLLNRRAVTPSRLVDITRLAELRKIELDGDVLRIGAAVRLAAIEKDLALVHFPLVAEAIASTASPAIRNRATLIGNLMRANAMSELAVVCVALGARLFIGRKGARRSISVADFLVGHHARAVDAGEMVLHLEIPRPLAASGTAFEEISARAGATPLICVAAVIEVDAKGVISKAHIVAGGIAGRPVHCAKSEAALTGQPLTGAAQRVVAEDVAPAAELPQAAYALEVLPVVMGRAVARATQAIASA
jgi:aerobic carbon-monoxide dehydrogenase medium subunit